MRPFFTIIVVSYNAGEDLINTLNSIKSQTFTDYRIIIKDGGSTDGSLERACEMFGTTIGDRNPDNVCTIVRQKDQGIYDAMNKAVEILKEKTRAELAMSDDDLDLNKRLITDAKRPGYVYFLNCGDLFSDNKVLFNVHEAIEKGIAEKGVTLPAIYYGDIYEMQTKQRVSSIPKINDFACYRNVPSHQACFYDERLMYRYPFDTVWKVRADYEHFLRCFYVERAQAIYTGLLIADYEGGGFSETKENRKVSETERQQIIHLYLSRSQIQKFDLIRMLTLAPVRTRIAQNPATAGVYNRLKRAIYKKKK